MRFILSRKSAIRWHPSAFWLLGFSINTCPSLKASADSFSTIAKSSTRYSLWKSEGSRSSTSLSKDSARRGAELARYSCSAYSSSMKLQIWLI